MGEFPAGAVNRAVSSQDLRLGLARAGAPDSVTMRQIRWSSSAMAAKYTGWGTVLGRRARDDEVKRTAESPGREAAAQPAAESVPPRPADHRRTGLRPPVPHRSETALRGLQATLRARLHPGHHQPAFRRVDRGVRIGTPHRRAAGSAHPPRPYPGDERRQLPPPPQPAERRLPGLGRAGDS